MRIESKLCHMSENKAVVRVIGWFNEKKAGSTLAQADTVELAEDKAIKRLYNRLNMETDSKNFLDNPNEEKIKTKLTVELPSKEIQNSVDINKEPSDWSNELTAIDSEIKRLKWSREDEISFLKLNLGYNNRSKITTYNDLLKYLDLLKNKKDSVSNKSDTKGFETLIAQSDIILRELSWNNKQGRDFLQKEFNVSTRKELDEKQLTSFVNKLESIRNQYFSD